MREERNSLLHMVIQVEEGQWCWDFTTFSLIVCRGNAMQISGMIAVSLFTKTFAMIIGRSERIIERNSDYQLRNLSKN